MKQYTTPAIVLRRTNYSETDRILTVLTPLGKMSVMARGVRASKSKMAGGIELFAENIVTLLETRGDMKRLTSSRAETSWSGIIGNLPKMMLGYEFMKIMDKMVESESEDSYYQLLKTALSSLSDWSNNIQIIELWFYVRALSISGHLPSFDSDNDGNDLSEKSLYMVNLDGSLSVSSTGSIRSKHIKLLRLLDEISPKALTRVVDVETIASELVASYKLTLLSVAGL